MKTNPLLHPHGIKHMCDTCESWDRGVCHSDKHSSSVYPRSLIELTDMLVHDCGDTANFITGPGYGCVHHKGA